MIPSPKLKVFDATNDDESTSVNYIGIMPKIPECDRCLFCAHDPHLVCFVHPDGVKGSTCIDFRPDPELEGKQFVDFLGIGETSENSHGDEQWEPEGASYYNGELIIQPRQRWTREQQLEFRTYATGTKCGRSFAPPCSN